LRSTAAIGAILSSLLGGCQGEVLEVGDDAQPPVVVPVDIADRCPKTSPTPRRFDSEESMLAALAGRWIRCRGVAEGVLFPPGLELTLDRDPGLAPDWYSLVDDGAGALVRALDDAHRGAWAPQPPLTLVFQFGNRARQELVVLLDESGTRLTVARSTFESVDVAYIRE
jgi:hypothetical protein